MSKTHAHTKEKAFTTSDLSRKRKDVMAAARNGTALVRDTDGTVIAMRSSEHVAVQDRLSDLNRVLRAVVASLRDAQPSAALLGDIAWLADWPVANREQFVLDFADAISLSESIGSTEPADAFLAASRPQAPTQGLFDATEAFKSLSEADRAVLRGERRTA